MERQIIRRRYRFYGRVQGVGFRYYAQYAADSAGVTGWVRNEYDGSVTMELQGSVFQMEQVLKSMQNGRFIRIDRMEWDNIPTDNNERRFRVRY